MIAEAGCLALCKLLMRTDDQTALVNPLVPGTGADCETKASVRSEKYSFLLNPDCLCEQSSFETFGRHMQVHQSDLAQEDTLEPLQQPVHLAGKFPSKVHACLDQFYPPRKSAVFVPII